MPLYHVNWRSNVGNKCRRAYSADTEEDAIRLAASEYPGSHALARRECRVDVIADDPPARRVIEQDIEEALTTAHAVIRESIHSDASFRQESLDKIEAVLGYDPALES